jgi:hypothetical protein
LPEGTEVPRFLHPLRGMQLISDRKAAQVTWGQNALMISNRNLQLNTSSHCLLTLGDGLPANLLQFCALHSYDDFLVQFRQLSVKDNQGQLY